MSERDATQASRSGSSLVILNGRDSGSALADPTPGAVASELTETDLREARRAFELKLRGKRMHPRWIEENAEELFAKAQQQYAEWLDAGRVAISPRAWLVHTAWRRAQDRLDYERRHGHSVALEDVSYAIADEKTKTPEQALLEGDRREHLLTAMGELKPEHRELLKLVYFDNLEVKEAGEILGWTLANASYHHKAVLKRLRGMLDGKIDLPEIGSAAAATLALERAEAFTFARLIEQAGETAGDLADRLGDLARRLLPASDPASASMMGGAARAGGVCLAAAAAVCLASGVVGPGVGVVDLIDPKPSRPPIRESTAKDPEAARPPATRVIQQASERPSGEKDSSNSAKRIRTSKAPATKAPSARQRSSRPAREAGEDQVNAEATAEPAYTEPIEPRPMSSEESAGSEVEPSPSPSPSPSRGSARETSPAAEFGF